MIAAFNPIKGAGVANSEHSSFLSCYCARNAFNTCADPLDGALPLHRRAQTHKLANQSHLQRSFENDQWKFEAP